MIATGEYTIVSLHDGNGIAETIVEYCLGLSGDTPPGLPLTDEHGDVLMSNNGEILTDGDWAETLPTPSPGEYLWTRTRFMLTDGTFDMIYNVSLYGESGDDGVSITTEKEQYYLSTANNSLTGGEWVYAQPLSIPSGRYLFRRWEFTMSDGTKQYSNAIYNSIMEGVINLTDELDQKITQKIWSTDIDTSISAYDNSTVSTIRSQLSQHEQTMDSISDTIQDFQSSVNGDLTTMSNRITTDEQTLDGFMQTVTNQQSTMSGDISTLQSATTSLTQTADDFRFFVARSGDGAASSTTLSITANGATMVGNSLTIKSPDNSRTVISGGKITTDLVKSNNYAYSSGNYSTAGTFIDLSNGMIRSKNFAIDSSGNAYFKGSGSFDGSITTTSATIGPWKINSDAIYKVSSTMGNSSSGAAYFGNNGLSITDKFKVTAAGALTSTDANIKGTVFATTGEIGGFEIASTSIHTKNVAVTSNASGSVAFASSNFTRTINGTSRNNLRFAIGSNLGMTDSGLLYATGGQLGGWILTANTLTSHDANNVTTGLQRQESGTWGLCVGATDPDSWATAPFRVKHNGELWAEKATITGKITATEGKIGGFIIETNNIACFTSVTAGTASTQYRVNLVGNNVGATSFALAVSNRSYNGSSYGGWNYPFYVRYDGYMVATNANISGTINASNGMLGGWELSSATIKATSGGKTTGIQIPSNGNWAFAAGSSNASSWADAPFRVKHDGTLYAKAGEIGAWTINSNGSLTNGYSILKNDNITISNSDNTHGCVLTTTYLQIGCATTTNPRVKLSMQTNATYGEYMEMLVAHSSEVTAFGFYIDGHLYVPGFVRAKAYNTSGPAVLIASGAAEGNRVSHMTGSSSGLSINAMWGNSTTYSTRSISISASDVRIKDNIFDTEECGVDFVNKIRLTKFDWKDRSGHKSIGIIADELEKLNPELVIGGGYEEDGSMNVKSIDTLELLSYAIKAIQELSCEIK